MKKLGTIIAVTLLTSTLASNAQAQDSNRTQLGILECQVEGGIGLLLGSSRRANCTFTHEDDSVEEYTGKLSKLGLDIGISGDSYLGWIVYTPVGNEYGSYAVAGKYVGISVAGALGIGLGVNALVGGSTKKIGLQPFSVEGKTGLNLAAGITTLTLTSIR